MKHNGAEITVKLLERQGIDVIPGIPGGANLPLYDALARSPIKHILVRHEQGGGFLAQGMARATGKTAVVFATSGPGATNLLTAVADAKLDSIPLVAVTGQVSSALIGTDAFQEVDTYGMTVPITKHNFLVRSARELFTVIPEAFRIAGEGRPGPVLVDIPKDVQNEVIEFEAWPAPYAPAPKVPVNADEVARVAGLLAASERPVLYAGGGVVFADGEAALLALSRKNGIPVTTTLMGLGAFPPDDPRYLGMLGMHGAPFTNYLLDEADLVISCGARFDDRATGKPADFCKNAKVVHIDIDRAEIDKIKRTDASITGDVGLALAALLPLVKENARPAWNKRVAEAKNAEPMPLPDAADPFHPLNVLFALARLAGPEAIITTDVGQHQMWVAQVYPFARTRSLLTSGGLGTMGFGLPAAIGAAVAQPERTVVCVSGDGSLLMNIQELATLADLGVNVKVLLLNNGHLGLVRQQQELFYKENYFASRFDTRPDFAAIARGFNVRAIDATGMDDPAGALADAINTPGPCLVNVPVRHMENVLPMVPPGAANTTMIGAK